MPTITSLTVSKKLANSGFETKSSHYWIQPATESPFVSFNQSTVYFAKSREIQVSPAYTLEELIQIFKGEDWSLSQAKSGTRFQIGSFIFVQVLPKQSLVDFVATVILHLIRGGKLQRVEKEKPTLNRKKVLSKKKKKKTAKKKRSL